MIDIPSELIIGNNGEKCETHAVGLNFNIMKTIMSLLQFSDNKQ